MHPTDVNSGLTAEKLKTIVVYDPETGLFQWVNKKKKTKISYNVGRKENCYQQMYLNKRYYFAHRLAWLFVMGRWPLFEMIDHINGRKSDNRFCNLREVTRSQNATHMHELMSHNTSGYRGVSPRKANGKWRATIRMNGKIRSLGNFQTREEAKAAYDAALREKFGPIRIAA